MNFSISLFLILSFSLSFSFQTKAQSIQELHEKSVYFFNQLHEYDSAIFYASKTIEADTLYSMAYYVRAYSHVNMNAWKPAMHDIQKAINIKPNVSDYIDIRGFIYDHDEKYELAIRDFDEAIRLSPEFSKSYYHRGTTYAMLENYTKAIDDYSHAISFDSTNKFAFYNRGNAYKKMNKLQKALSDYTYTIKLDKFYEPAYFNRARLFTDLKKYDNAIQDYKTAIRLDPSDLDALLNIGLLQMDYKKDYPAAIVQFDRLIHLDPSFKNVYCCRAMAKSHLHNLDGALTDINTELVKQPRDAYIISKKAYILCEKGDYQGAVSYYSKAIDIEKDAHYYYERARNYNLMGYKLKAKEDYKKALDLNPTYKSEIPASYK